MSLSHEAEKNADMDVSDCVVLLVDDEADILHSLSRSFRHQPFTTHTARSAEDAMAILESHRVDLVVSDERMPGISGSTFMSWIAKHFPDVTRIILTGAPNVDSALDAINNGQVYRYFTKPCDIIKLTLAIRDGLEESISR